MILLLYDQQQSYCQLSHESPTKDHCYTNTKTYTIMSTTKENVPMNQLESSPNKGTKRCSSASPIRQSSCKKRKTITSSVSTINHEKENNQNEQSNWEQLYHQLKAERVTKAESLLYAYQEESEEREQLMRSYNQELEQDNKRLKRGALIVSQQKQQIQDLQKQMQELKALQAKQETTIGIYRAMTGATLSNLPNNNQLDCDCTFTNPETKVTTTFRLSTVQKDPAPEQAILKYTPLENPQPLPSFLHEEIEFESTQLPPLLQNVLRGIFPEDES